MNKRVSFVLSAFLIVTMTLSTSVMTFADGASETVSSAVLEKAEKELKSAETNYRNASAEYSKAKTALESAAAEQKRARSEYERITGHIQEVLEPAAQSYGKNLDSLLQNQDYTMDSVTSYGFIYVETTQSGLLDGGMSILDDEVPLAGLPILEEENKEVEMHFPWVLCGVLGLISVLVYLYEKSEAKRQNRKRTRKMV